MKTTLIAAAFLTAIARCAAAQPQDDERSIPAKFQGEWNTVVADCGTANNDSRLVISANEVQFYESGGAVRGAFLHGPYEILIVLDMSGEGSSWMTSFQWTMASDGSYLSDRSVDGSLFVRYRCPAA
jgi:hypothetical protein